MTSQTRDEIIAVRADHGFGVMQFEHTRQDRRDYFRLLVNGAPGGSLTDERHARETIAYWRAKGWVK